MTDIKLKSKHTTLCTSHIDLARDKDNLGLFAILWNDPDGSKGARLVQCWNERDELVAMLEAIVVETMDCPPTKPYSSDSYLPPHLIDAARSLLARAKGTAP